MKQWKLIDKAIVAALLLAYVPGLAEDVQLCSLPEPALLLAAAQETPVGDTVSDEPSGNE